MLKCDKCGESPTSRDTKAHEGRKCGRDYLRYFCDGMLVDVKPSATVTLPVKVTGGYMYTDNVGIETGVDALGNKCQRDHQRQMIESAGGDSIRDGQTVSYFGNEFKIAKDWHCV